MIYWPHDFHSIEFNDTFNHILLSLVEMVAFQNMTSSWSFGRIYAFDFHSKLLKYFWL